MGLLQGSIQSQLNSDSSGPRDLWIGTRVILPGSWTSLGARAMIIQLSDLETLETPTKGNAHYAFAQPEKNNI